MPLPRIAIGAETVITAPIRLKRGTATLGSVILQIIPTLFAIQGGPLMPGGTATLRGWGFHPNTTLVNFPGVAAPVQPTSIGSQNQSRTALLHVPVPSGVTSGSITVTSDGGTSNAIPIPDLQAINAMATRGVPADPSAPSANTGQTVQIGGSGFSTNTNLFLPGTTDTGLPIVLGTNPALFIVPFNISTDRTTADIQIPTPFSGGAPTTGIVTLNGLGSVALQIVPTLDPISLPLGEVFGPGVVLTLSGSGFKEGATTVLFSGVSTPVPAGDVFQNNLALTVTIPPGAIVGPIIVKTDGGSSTSQALASLQGIVATAVRGVPANSVLPSANIGQFIQLEGTGFHTNMQIAFPTTDDSGVAGTAVLIPSSVDPNGNTATFGNVTIDGLGAVAFQIVPTVDSISFPFGQTFAPGVEATLTGTGFKEGVINVIFQGASPVPATDVLNGNTSLTVTIPSGAVDGLVTVEVDGSAGTLDVGSPRVISIVPFDGQNGVALNSLIAIFFDERIDPNSISSSTFNMTGPNGPIAGTVSRAPDLLSASFIPTQALSPDSSHSISIGVGIKDLAGNLLLNPGIVSFVTGNVSDTTGPGVIESRPGLGALGAPTNVIVRIEFDEPIFPLSATDQTVLLFTGGAQIPVDISFELNNMVVRLQPTNLIPLQANTLYDLTVTTGVTDQAGNPLATQFTSSFTTESGSDTTLPTVTSRSPVDGATMVPVDTTIQVTFSEPIAPATVDFNNTFTLMGGGFTGNIPGTFSFSTDRQTITLTPDFPLFADSTFFVTLKDIEDSSGNRLVETTSSFTTGSGAGSGVIPDIAFVGTSSTTVFADGQATTKVFIQNVSSSDGALVPDGTFVAVTADPAFQSGSAGGTIYGGTTSSADPRFQIFSTVRGRVDVPVTYQSQSLVLPPGFTSPAHIQVSSVTAGGIPISLIGNSTITLVTSTTAIFSINPTELIPDGVTSAAITMTVRDTFGKSVPSNQPVAVQVNPKNREIGTIVGGVPSPNPDFQLFTTKAGGLVEFTYTSPVLTQTPFQTTSDSLGALIVDAGGNPTSGLGCKELEVGVR